MRDLKFKLREAAKSFKKMLMSFEVTKDIPSSVGLSALALERNSLDVNFPYQDFDRENNLFFMDANDELSVGFGFIINPMLLQGDALASSINSLISKLPIGTTFSTMIYSSPVVGYLLDNWEKTKNIRGSVMSTKLVEKRKEYLELGAMAFPVTSATRLYSRDVYHMVTIKYPFTGSLSSEDEINEYLSKLLDLQGIVFGNLRAAGLSPSHMDPDFFHYVLWHLLNPQKINKNQRIYKEKFQHTTLTPYNLLDKDTRVRVTPKSSLLFSDGDDPDNVVEVVPMTVDEYPEHLYPQMAGALIGELVDKDSRISSPFFMYSHVEIVNNDKARRNISLKKFLIQKQLISESDFAKNQLADMFRRRDDANTFLNETKGKNRPVRMMTGVNIYTTPERRNIDIEEVENVFKTQEYIISTESFIGVPMFLSSLPFVYDPKTDRPNAGLQRSQMLTSFNASCGGHFSGEWKGTPTNVEPVEGQPPAGGGMMMIGPKGQLGAIDLFESDTNFNGVCIGTSGAGKSFFMAEIASDIFCRNGVVRIIDVGRSYYNLCENLSGQNVVFDTSDPISLNPFWGISDKGAFDKLAEFWRDLLVTMAYPGGRPSNSWEFRFIQEAVSSSWKEHGEYLELSKIVSEMIKINEEKFNNDERGNDVVYQLSPYADPLGIFYPWFSGPCQLNMDNDFMVFELDELNSTPELKAIVLMMVTNQIEKELYLSDRSRWRLSIIDEAYDLLRNPMVGKVIEYLFRKARKYKGSCIVGTQSFADMYYNEGTKGVIANSAWKFILKQEASSVKKAFDEEIVARSDFMENVISNVAPGSDYGELFIKTAKGFDVLYRFVTDPYSYFTYSSADMAKVQKIASSLVEKNPDLNRADSIALAIEQLSDKKMEEKKSRENKK